MAAQRSWRGVRRWVRPSTPPALATRLGVTAVGAAAVALGATVVEVRQRARSAGGLSALRPNADLARNVAARLTTPLLPDDYLRLVKPLWTARELRGEVVAVVPETDDAATLVIKPGWGWTWDHAAGQYAGIGVSLGGRWQWRSYSISSAAAEETDTITVTVKAMPEGLLSTHLVRGLEPGTIIRLALPQGGFVLPDPPPPRILFWTGGSGVTPVMAMLRTLDRRHSMPDVVHIHSAPTASSAIFADELRGMAKANPTMRLIINADDTDGRFDVSRLAAECPDWAEREAWVCGPAPMLDAAERHWASAGVPRRLHLERFSVQLSDVAEGGRIEFSRSGKNAEADGATTLLEAGEKAGVPMPFGCRMGVCHTCVVTLRQGRVKDLRNGTVYEDHQKIQTCVTAPAGDCSLDV